MSIDIKVKEHLKPQPPPRQRKKTVSVSPVPPPKPAHLKVGGSTKPRKRASRKPRNPQLALSYAELFKNSRPDESTINYGGLRAKRVRHREFFSECLSSTTFQLTELDMTPSNPVLFPWLSQQATSYESFVFNSLFFRYQPASSALTPGFVAICPIYDSETSAPTDVISAMNFDDADMTESYKPMLVACSKSNLHKRKSYYINPDLSDDPLNSVGNVYLINANQETNDEGIGWFVVEYDVLLLTPVMNLSAPSAIIDCHDPTPSTPTNIHPLGGTTVYTNNGRLDNVTFLASNSGNDNISTIRKTDVTNLTNYALLAGRYLLRYVCTAMTDDNSTSPNVPVISMTMAANSGISVVDSNITQDRTAYDTSATTTTTIDAIIDIAGSVVNNIASTFGFTHEDGSIDGWKIVTSMCELVPTIIAALAVPDKTPVRIVSYAADGTKSVITPLPRRNSQRIHPIVRVIDNGVLRLKLPYTLTIETNSGSHSERDRPREKTKALIRDRPSKY